jgi:hypothetical protein
MNFVDVGIVLSYIQAEWRFRYFRTATIITKMVTKKEHIFQAIGDNGSCGTIKDNGAALFHTNSTTGKQSS